MNRNAFVEQTERDAKIVNAIHCAHYALVRHHSLPVTINGKQYRMDFAFEIEKLTEIMELLGIDASQRLMRR
jgi:hypothetical protein